MKNKNPHNPNNSHCLQALIEMKAAGVDIPESLITSAKGVYANAVAKADKALAAKMYPDKKVRFVQLQMNVQPIFTALSDRAKSVYMLMVLNVGQNGLVSLSTQHIVEYLGCSFRDVKTTTQELLASGLIGVYQEARPRHAAIYSVNPEYAVIGTGRTAKVAWSMSAFEDAPRNTTTWTHITIRMPDGTTYNDIVPFADTEKEPSDGGTSKGSKATASRKSSRNNDNTIPGQMTIDEFLGDMPS